MIRAASFLSLGPLAAKMSFRRWKCSTLSAPPSTCPTLPQESSCWKLWRYKWASGLLTVSKKGVEAGNNAKGCQASHLVFSSILTWNMGPGLYLQLFSVIKGRRGDCKSEFPISQCQQHTHCQEWIALCPAWVIHGDYMGQILGWGEGDRVISI